ncbi:MAG: hypothetical protein ABL901_04255 [Hyphomicrobiaceae bacterium]
MSKQQIDPEVLPALSRFIAGMIGPVLAVLGCSLFLNQGLTTELAAEIGHSKGLILFSGVLLLIAGIAIIQCHATWRGWPAIITGLGWLSVISGLVRILFPVQLANMAPNLVTPTYTFAAAAICLALGAFLTAKAYL